MHFFLMGMSEMYVLSTPIPDNGGDGTMEQIRKMSKWENDDYVCKGLIFNGISDTLFDIYQFHGFTKELKLTSQRATMLLVHQLSIWWKIAIPPDIQCSGSDTRPPMLDRTDFASWQQHIRLYCQGKENGVNILKSIDAGPFQMGDVREPLAEGTEGAPHLGPERPRSRHNRGQGTNPRGRGAAGYGGVQNRVGNANQGQARQVKCYNYIGIGHIARNCTQPKHPHNSDYYKDKMLLMQAHENGVAFDEEQLLLLAGRQDTAIDEDVDEQPVQDLALNVDNVFQADNRDAFDFDVDKAPTAQTMFMANLSSTNLIDDEAEPSYDLDILSKYVKDNAVLVVHSNVSSVPNDAYMMIYNDMYKPHAQSVSKTSPNIVVKNSLTAKLATYKEQVELYESWARNVEKELHSIKLQLASTIDHNKLMVEEVTSMKKDFKEKENKYLEDFLDTKSLKEKVDDRLFKQD
nr:zinc finger, CCHC-type [Tanacetum cinerariifolium]